MTTAPPVNGQIIGQAHYATRAVLERMLAATGTTFHQSVALNAIAGSGGTVERRALVARMTGTLKIDATAAVTAVSELTSAGLLEEPAGDTSWLSLTAAGAELQRTHSTGLAGIMATLYAGQSPEDLATAGRVLTEVTARANAVLAEG